MAFNMSVTFLGSCSGGGPVESRSCSSQVLNIEGDGSLWLFDCAEGTTRQFLLLPEPKTLKVLRVNKIFISHMHYDHVMGLITLLANRLRGAFIGQLPNRDVPPIMNIYGPAGLRTFVRSILKMTSTALSERYAVHELLTTEDPITSCASDDLLDGEAIGQDIVCDADGFWRNFLKTNRTEIDAGPILHRAPCLGYIFREISAPHRKLVILGDTHDASALAPLAQNATLLVHEATDAYIPSHIDAKMGRKDPEEIKKKTIAKGHSTPVMAGEFARLINAKQLVLNHFSAKFPAPQHHHGWRYEVMNEFELQASEAWGLGRAIAAVDYTRIELPGLNGGATGPDQQQSRRPQHNSYPQKRGRFEPSHRGRGWGRGMHGGAGQF